MLRIDESTSPTGILRYFLESLVQEEFKELRHVKEPGYWVGALAERLGLTGVVTREAFAAMLTNVNPGTGEALTPRTKDGRRCCYELEVSAPKSLSVMYALTNDSRLLDAFSDAVRQFADVVQDEARTRVRRDGADEDRPTRELATAVFIQRLGRPVAGIEDPQVHAHMLPINATWDPVEQRIKALQFGDAWTLAPLLEAKFMSILAEKVMGLGYSVRNKGPFWEIDGVPDSVVEKFSNRTDVIKQVARDRGITDPDALDRLGAMTRERKSTGSTYSNLKAVWASRLTHDERQTLFRLKDDAELAYEQRHAPRGAQRQHPGLNHSAAHAAEAERVESNRLNHGHGQGEPGQEQQLADGPAREQDKGESQRRPLAHRDQHALREAVREAAGKMFERQAVVREDLLLSQGLRAAPGRISVDQVREEMASQGIITRTIKGRAMSTTREAVAEEQLLVQLAVAGKGKFVRSSTNDWRAPAGMTAEQREALATVLGSPDLVTIVKGRAGVGKTYLTKATVQQIVDRLNRPVCMLAPTANASRKILREEGHRRADTVAKFLNDPKMQARAGNGVIWVDEAGLLSMKDAIGLLQKAAALGCRVVFSGDSENQNKSVARGSVMASLHEHAAVRTVGVEGVQRQKGAYKDVVDRLNQR